MDTATDTTIDHAILARARLALGMMREYHADPAHAVHTEDHDWSRSMCDGCAADWHAGAGDVRIAVRLAASDPTDAASLADAVVDADRDLEILAAIHPGTTLRADGRLVPAGAEWTWSDGGVSGSLADAVDVHDWADDAVAAIDPDDWRCGDEEETTWVSVRVWLPVVTAAGYAGRIESHETLQIDPCVPACSHDDGHEWDDCPHRPVVGHGGGVITREVCRHCGTVRVTDTWAQCRATGEQGLTSVRYETAEGGTP